MAPYILSYPARTLVATIHRDPGAGGYAALREAQPDELITPLLAPQLAVRLADLGLGDHEGEA